MQLNGTGFPFAIQDATITICAVNATIISIANTYAHIIMPPCQTGTQDIWIFTSTLTSNKLSFNYVTPNPLGYIFTVNPQSYNPSLKGIMQITGIGFGTDQKAVRVDLANSTGKVYHMRILTLNDTYIKVGIPGGLAGKFKVQVNKIGVG